MTVHGVTVTYSNGSFLDYGSYRKRAALCWKNEDLPILGGVTGKLSHFLPLVSSLFGNLAYLVKNGFTATTGKKKKYLCGFVGPRVSRSEHVKTA